MNDVTQPTAPEASDAEHHAAFVRTAYRAALDRDPAPEEVAPHAASMSDGQSPTAFLEMLLGSEERHNLIVSRQAPAPRAAVGEDEARSLVAVAYRAVLVREPDREGLETGCRLLRDGVSASAYLESLMASEEARVVSMKAQSSAPPDAADFVRNAFEYVLNRSPDENDVRYYVAALDTELTPASLLGALGTSPEGKNLRRQRGFAPLLAACGSLTAMLESMLRKRGMTLDLGRVPEFDVPGAQAEATLKSLVLTIEMLAAETAKVSPSV